MWTKRSFYINDATVIKDGKLLVHDGTCYPWATGGRKPEHSVEAEHVICDLVNPKDIIINEETIAPPGIKE